LVAADLAQCVLGRCRVARPQVQFGDGRDDEPGTPVVLGRVGLAARGQQCLETLVGAALRVVQAGEGAQAEQGVGGGAELLAAGDAVFQVRSGLGELVAFVAAGRRARSRCADTMT
jgi:hypothetical protein